MTPGDPSFTQPCSPALPRPSPHRPCWFLGARQGSEPPGKEETEALRVPPAAPSAPTSVKFSELTTTSVNVSWEAPQSPNGVLEGYRLVYEPCTPVDGEWPRAQQPRPASRPTLHGLPPGRGPSPAHTHTVHGAGVSRLINWDRGRDQGSGKSRGSHVGGKAATPGRGFLNALFRVSQSMAAGGGGCGDVGKASRERTPRGGQVCQAHEDGEPLMVWLCVLPQIQGLSFTPGLAAFAFWGVRNSFGNLIKALEPLPRRIHEFGRGHCTPVPSASLRYEPCSAGRLTPSAPEPCSVPQRTPQPLPHPSL